MWCRWGRQPMARRLMKNDPSPSIPYEEWGFFSWADKDERTVEEVFQCWFHELTRELTLRGMLVPEPLKVLVFSGELPQRAFLDTDENPRANLVSPEFIARVEMFAPIHPAWLALPGRESKCNFPLNIDWNAGVDEITDRVAFLLRVRKAVMEVNPYIGKKRRQKMQSDLKRLAACRLMRSGMTRDKARQYAKKTTGKPIYTDLGDWSKAKRKINELLDSMSKLEGQDILEQLEYLYATPIHEFWKGEQMIEVSIPPEK